jgi:LysM repeat protein
VTVPPNAVTAPNGPANVYCRILTTNAEIGVTDSNLIRAVEIFALSVNGQNSITRFNLPVQVCLLGTGSLLFRDANAAPRAPEAIASQSEGGYTCTSIPNAGTVVLIGGDTPQPSPSAPTVPSSISVAGTHVVQPGENLFRIALRYGVPVNLLAAVNNITDPRRIFVGQSLIIPSTTAGAILLPSTPLPIATVATTTLLPEGENFLHEVMWGQTLYSIALRYGLTVSDIAVANNIVNPRLIYPGQILVIPLGEVAETHALPTIQRQHIVQYGETLWRIAQYYQVSLTAIATVNQITNINLIQVGQVLIIP